MAVVVPIPTRVLLPPLAKMALGLRVEVVVAQKVSDVPDPPPSSASHPNLPPFHVKTLLDWQVARSAP